MMFSVLVSCVPETEFDEQFLEDKRDPFVNSSLLLRDTDSNSKSHTNSTSINIQVNGDEKAAKWCLSELQSSVPTIASCNGGEGSSNGWHSSKPTTFTLSGGDGVKTLYLWLVKPNGSVRAASINSSIVLDTQAPTVTINPASDINLSNANPYTLSGNCTDSENVKISLGGVNYSAVCSSGTWAYSGDVRSSSDGSITINVTQTDKAGNISNTASDSVSKDSTAPTITVTSPAQNGFVNNSNKSSYTFSGTCSEDGTISISGAITDTIACSSGSFSKSIDLSGQSDGALSFNFDLDDAVGNPATQKSVNVTKDIVAPTVAITSPAASSYANNTTKSAFTVLGSCSENGQSVSFSGAITDSVTCSSGSFSKALDVSGVSDGAFTINVDIADAAGNAATQNSRSFNKDIVAPTITQTTYTSASFSKNNTVTFGGACENGSSITVSGTDTNSATCSSSSWTYTTSAQTSDASYSYTFTHTDPAGNSSAVSSSWQRDGTVPSVDNVVVAGGSSNISTINTTVSVTASDNNTVSFVRLANANSATNECQSEYADDNWQSYSGGSQVYPHTVSSGDGVKKICVWSKDLAGNVSIISPALGNQGVNVDTVTYDVGTPPVVTSFVVTNNTAGGNFGSTNFLAGDQVKVEWNVIDSEGFSDDPISLYYTTDNSTWISIVEGYGGTSPSSPYSNSYLSFNAPTSGYFKLKIVVKDLANNTNIDTFSPPLNTGNWLLYAGNTSMGIGGNYNSVQLKKTTYGLNSGQLAVNPLNNDIYFVSYQVGILKSNAITGKVDYFVKHGSNNLPSSGTINLSTSRVPSNTTILRFDKDGTLYAKVGTKFYRINVSTLEVKELFGGGSNFTSPYTASNIAVLTSASFDIDLNKNLYFYINCFEPTGTWGVNSNNTAKIVKAVYDSSGDSYSFLDFAGNCVAENPSGGGSDSLTQGIGLFCYEHLLDLAVNGDGSLLYYGQYATYKIINSKTYTTSIGGKSKYIDKLTNDAYAGSGTLYKYTNTMALSDNSENTGTHISLTGGVNCNEDGTDISSACVNIYHGNSKGEVYVGYSSNVYFIDAGPRVRFISTSDNKLYTALGSKALYGEGLDKQFLRTQGLGGIYYKRSSEPNQASFPEGLYFTDEYSMVIGHINPSTGAVSIVGGDQSITAGSWSSAVFGTSTSFGRQQSSHNLASLGFDSSGLPWFVTETKLRASDASKNIINKQTGSSSWSMALQGDNPAGVSSHYYLGTNNLVVSGDGIFTLGNSKTSSSRTKGAVIQYHDYGGSSIEHILGGQLLPTEGYSADSLTPGSTTTLTLSSICNNPSTCSLSSDQIKFLIDLPASKRVTSVELLASLGDVIYLKSSPSEKYSLSAEESY